MTHCQKKNLKEVTFVNFALADFCQFCIFVKTALSPRNAIGKNRTRISILNRISVGTTCWNGFCLLYITNVINSIFVILLFEIGF